MTVEQAVKERNKLRYKGSKLCAEGDKLRAKGAMLYNDGDFLVIDAVAVKHGPDADVAFDYDKVKVTLAVPTTPTIIEY